jgi:uncharacterized protein with PQ loop repeat
MPVNIAPLITTSVEYQNWGLNTITLSFILSIAVTTISAWGLVKQNQIIWKTKQAEGVSVFWLSYYLALQLAILIYGLSLNSAALVLNGLLAALYFPVLWGLWKFKGFSSLEKLLALILAMAILAMALLPFKTQFFFVFAVGGLVSAAMQPLEMWRKKSAEGLSIKLIGTLLFGTAVWFTYGVAVQDWVLISINLVASFIFSSVILLWGRYRRQGEAKQT